jgi:hypothetical protein
LRDLSGFLGENLRDHSCSSDHVNQISELEVTKRERNTSAHTPDDNRSTSSLGTDNKQNMTGDLFSSLKRSSIQRVTFGRMLDGIFLRTFAIASKEKVLLT